MYKCKYTCSHLSAYLLPRTRSYVPGAINPGGADERASRGSGESVGKVGVAVTVTGLVGIACVANTRSDAGGGIAFHHWRWNDKNMSADVSTAMMNLSERSWKGHVDFRHDNLITKKEIHSFKGIYRWNKIHPHYWTIETMQFPADVYSRLMQARWDGADSVPPDQRCCR